MTCCFLLFSAAALAQPAIQATRFTVFAAKPVQGLAFVPRAGAAPQPVRLYPTARSPRYEYRGAMPLRFIEEATGVVVAEATIPAGMTEALLLLLPAEPGATTKLKYQVAVLDDGAARHGPGGLAIVNLSGLALSGTVNAEKVTLKPGLNPTLPVGRSAKIALSAPFKGKTRRSYAETVNLGAGERALLILFPPFHQGSLEAQARLLVDRLPMAEKR